MQGRALDRLGAKTVKCIFSTGCKVTHLEAAFYTSLDIMEAAATQYVFVTISRASPGFAKRRRRRKRRTCSSNLQSLGILKPLASSLAPPISTQVGLRCRVTLLSSRRSHTSWTFSQPGHSTTATGYKCTQRKLVISILRGGVMCHICDVHSRQLWKRRW